MLKRPEKISVPIALIFIFMLAFSIRMAMNMVFQGINSPPDPDMGSDHVEYDRLAQNMVKGNGYVLTTVPNISRPPGTSFLLALVYRVFGIRYAFARIFFSLLSAATCIVIYFLGSKLYNKKTGLWAALVLSVYPMHFAHSMHFLSEVPWTLFMSLTALSAVLLQERTRMSYSVLLGLLVGFSAYIRPTSIFYLPIFISLLIIYGAVTDKKRFFLFCAIPITVFLLAVLPWTIRNYRVAGHFVPIATRGGITFLGAHNEDILSDPRMTGSWLGNSREALELRTNLFDPYTEEKEAYRIGFAFVGKHLKDMPRLEMMKLYRLVTPFFETPNRLFNLIGGISWGMLMPFCLFGIAITVKNRYFASLHAAVLLTLFMGLIFYGDHRFREAISPFLVLYGCVGFFDILRRLKITGKPC